MSFQVPSLVLPFPYLSQLSTLTIADALTHISVDLTGLEQFDKKTVVIWAAEVVGAGIPGTLNCWIEPSPFPSSLSTSYFGAIGGGGGVLPPVAPVSEVGTGVNGTIHVIILPWTIFAPFARVVIQTPIVVATAVWAVQAWFMGGSI